MKMVKSFLFGLAATSNDDLIIYGAVVDGGGVFGLTFSPAALDGGVVA